mmetsp:Transcript_54422/g.127032  ORF Transcript_54422/g.127032 Transcript_54422/m.127032 type:complete len:94 (+) Transcript_54422:411-692(+)
MLELEASFLSVGLTHSLASLAVAWVAAALTFAGLESAASVPVALAAVAVVAAASEAAALVAGDLSRALGTLAVKVAEERQFAEPAEGVELAGL